MRAGWVKWVAIVALTGACADGGDADTAATDSVPAVSTPAPSPAPTLGDAEIAHVAVTANTIDKEAGEHALSKSTNADIKQFAQTMITDHTGVNQQAAALELKALLEKMRPAIAAHLQMAQQLQAKLGS